LLNNDPENCLVTECKFLKDNVVMTNNEFIWVDIENISINTDPNKEFNYNSLKVQCSNRNTTEPVTSLEFGIESKCTNNIDVSTPPGFVASQTYIATINDLAKSKFLFDSFKTTTSACQVETYYVYNSLTN
jgi:hypothetical protein